MKDFPKYRKGQQLNISSLGVVAITIVIAAIVLGLGGTILDRIQGTQTDNVATTPDNESWTWPGNDTIQSFVQSRVSTSSAIVWCNDSLLVVNQNYTVNSSGVAIINTSGSVVGIGVDIDECTFNMTYNYNYGSDAYNSSDYGLTGMVTMSEFIPTIAIVAVAAIVIGILLVFFGRRKEE